MSGPAAEETGMPAGRRSTAVTALARFPSPWRLTVQLVLALTIVAGIPSFSPQDWGAGGATVAAAGPVIKLPFAAGAEWYISQGYNTSPTDGWSHYNCDPKTGKDEISETQRCDAGWQYKYSFDLRRVDGTEAGQPVLSPVDGTIRWIDNHYGGMSIDLGNGYAVAFYHVDLARGLAPGQAVRLGQKLGVVAGPGEAGNGGTPHIHVTLWRTEDGGNWSRIAVPFTDDYPLDGYDFPALGDRQQNQYWNTVVVSSNQPSQPSAPSASTGTPATPVPTGPASGSVFTGRRDQPVLTWNPVADADEYQVVLNGGERASAWLSDTSWDPGRLPAGDYSWQVKARNGAGESTLSDPWTFTIEAKSGKADEATPETGATAAATPAATPGVGGAAWLNLAAASAVVGTKLTVNGAGFGAGETVRLHWDSSDAPALAEANAGDGGAWTATLPIPSAVFGGHQIVAVGDATGRRGTADLDLIPSLGRDPVAGPPGTTITVTVAGFGATESVDLRWGGESGATLAMLATDQSGGGSAQIVIPDGSAGATDLAAVGLSSGARALGTVRVATAGTAAATPGGDGGSGEVVGGGNVLGPGTFQVTATVEGLVGGGTSSGHTIQPDDRFVSLPACTTTSCPWLDPGVADPLFGTRIECGDACYVRVTNPANGRCAVAPVLETGPWFTLDDWWNPPAVRALNNLPTTVNRLAQGYPGAAAALDGLDVGYGRAPNGAGISNKGYEVGNRAAIDLATGTWQDIGFDPNTGIGTVVVTILWQTGEDPSAAAAACGTPTGAATPEATPVATPVAGFEGRKQAAQATAAPTAEAATPVATPSAAPTATAVATAPPTEPTAEDRKNADKAVAKANKLRERHGLPPLPDAAAAAGDETGVADPAPATDGSAPEVASDAGASGVTDAANLVADPTTADPPAVPAGDNDKDRSAEDRSKRDRNDAKQEAPTTGDSNGAAGAPAGRDAGDGGDQAENRIDKDRNPQRGGSARAADGGGKQDEPAGSFADDGSAAAQAADPNGAPTGSTLRELVFLPVADTSVSAAAPDTPQPAEQAATLPIGGPPAATAYLTFQVDGIAAGTVVDARLILTGSAEGTGAGGALTDLPGFWVDEAGLTFQTAPASQAVPALTAAGAAATVDWLQPGVETAVDVGGTVTADGVVTFALAGSPDALTGIASRESATPPRLVLTVIDPGAAATGG